MLDIIASLILLWWLVQGLYTAGRIRNEGYHPLWWFLVGGLALALLLPATLIWL